MNKKLLIPAIIIGLLVAGILVTLLLSGPRMRHHASLEAFEAELQQPPKDAVTFHDHSFDPSKMELPEANKKNMHRGEVYYNYYCVFCHGEKGEGNGPVGQSYVPKPTDLHADSIHQKNKTEFYKAVFKGTGHSPVLERVVPKEHRKYIIRYVKEQFEQGDN